MTLYGINELTRGLSVRQMMLAGVALCRSRWDHFTDDEARYIVELNEAVVDAPFDNLESLFRKLRRETEFLKGRMHQPYFETTVKNKELRACRAATMVSRATPLGIYDILSELFIDDWEDILSTFKAPVQIDPQPRHVVQIAEAIYKDREWEALPILADAMEEAGCDQLIILGHLRREQFRARGFWVVDQILEKL